MIPSRPATSGTSAGAISKPVTHGERNGRPLALAGGPDRKMIPQQGGHVAKSLLLVVRPAAVIAGTAVRKGQRQGKACHFHARVTPRRDRVTCDGRVRRAPLLIKIPPRDGRNRQIGQVRVTQ